MKKEFFIFFPYFNMLYLEGAVTATGKYNISLIILIPYLINSYIVFPKHLSFTMIEGVLENKDDYYGK